MKKAMAFCILLATLFTFSCTTIEEEDPNINGGGDSSSSHGTEPSSDSNGGTPQTSALETEVTDDGTILRGSTLAAKLAWLDRSAESHNTYIIEVGANENIPPHTFQYAGAINITVILRGDGSNRTIRLSSHGTMFTVKANVTLVLDNNITLQSHSQNTGDIIRVDDGILKVNDGASIIGDTGKGSGVYVHSGNFEMNGGTISGFDKDSRGGGVYVRSGNFEMNGGTISGNTANGDGGGVYFGGETFAMSGGTISGNAGKYGGGVFMYRGTFEMSGGTISNNTASDSGGGVYMDVYYPTTSMYIGGIFTKIGGTITGYGSDQESGNVVKDNAGVIARRGHAVYIATMRKETTSGPDDNISFSGSATGAWDE